MTEGQSIALGDVSVCIGMPVDNPIPHKTVMSLCSTVQRLTAMGIRHAISMHVSGVIQIGRDNVLDDFLQGGLDKLFWIDSDMVWSPDDFVRLLAISTKVDVVGAAYPAKVEGATTFYANFDADRKIGPFGLQEIKGLGLGFTIVSREVCEKLSADAPKVKDQISGTEVASVFRVDVSEDGHRRTEDMAFFADIRAAGYPVWLDPGISLGHIGEREWRGRISDAFSQGEQAA